MSATQKKIAVLASGRGSNFEALALKFPTQIALVLSDQAQAPVLEKAKAKSITARHLPIQKGADWGSQYAELIHQAKADFVVLAGFMRILPENFIKAFDSRRGYSKIVNIHPSLLPAFPGLNGYAQAFEYGAKTTGATVHLVDNKLDHGPICAQKSFSIEECKSIQEVETQGLKIEHELYPTTLAWVLEEKFEIIGGRRCVRKS